MLPALQINGKPMMSATHDVVLSILRTERSVTVLLCPFVEMLAATPVATVPRVVVVSRTDNKLDAELAYQALPQLPFVRRVEPESAAANKLNVGDVITSINGQDTAGMSQVTFDALLQEEKLTVTAEVGYG